MNDYLSNLVARCFDPADTIRPRPKGLFEPTPSTDRPTFDYDPEQDASGEVHIHGEEKTEIPTSVSSLTRPVAVDSPPATSEPVDSGTIPPKIPEPAFPPVVSQQARAETESNPFHLASDPEDPALLGISVRITPSIPGGDDPTPPPVETPAEAINLQHVEVPAHQRKTILESPASSDKDKLSSDFEKPPSKIPVIERRLTDRPDAESIVIRPHVAVYAATHIENAGRVPVEGRARSNEPASVNVTIGRVEVRAIMPDARPAPRPRTTKSGPSVSLDEYLKRRNEGQR